MRLFSIICPVYNTEKYLNECIDSVLNQEFSNWELILVDDGSTDSSGKICDCFAAKDSRIKVFHKKNEGQFLAREFGLSKRNGDYIIFLDSDDFIEKNLLSSMNRILDSFDADLILYDSDRIDIEGNKVDNKNKIAINAFLNTNLDILRICFLDNCSRISLCSYCFKSRLFYHDFCFPLDKTIKSQEDFMMLYEIVKIAKTMCVVEEHFYNYRFNQMSTSHNLQINDVKAGLLVSTFVFDELINKYGFSISEISSRVFKRLSWLPVSYLRSAYKRYNKKVFKKETHFLNTNFLYERFTLNNKSFDKSTKLLIFAFRHKLFFVGKILSRKK